MKKINFLIISMVALVLYYPVFKAGYVWDDNLLFVEKVKLINEPLSWKILTEPVLPGTTYFRPLIFLTIYIEFYLFGQNPLSSHIINFTILLINSSLISLIAYKLLLIRDNKNKEILGLLAGVIYVVNPVLVEATAWISGRFDLLITTFTLCGVYLFINDNENKWKRDILISVCFFLALLSKELGVVFPILLFFMYMFLNVSNDISYKNNIIEFIRNYKYLLMLMLMVFAFYFVLRVNSMGVIYHQNINMDYFRFSYLKEMLPVHSLFFYMKQFVFPFSDLTPLLPFEELNNNKYSIFLKIIAIILLFIFSIYAVLKKNKYIWLVFSIFISIVLVIYLIPITIANNIAHNRFMTLGAAFFSILIVNLPFGSFSKIFKIFSIFLIITWIGVSGIITRSIVPFWQSDFTLWKWTYIMQPNNSLARSSYLYGLYQSRNFDEIIKIVKKTQAVNSNRLSISDQIIYVNTLISMNDYDAINYAKGIELLLPKYHLVYGKNSDYRNSDLSNANIATFYGAYALATAVFEHDFYKALNLNKIAYWYLDEDEKITYLYNEVAYLYLSGRFADSKVMYDRLKKIKAYDQERYDYNMRNIILMECVNKKMVSSEICVEENKKIINRIG